MVVKKTPKKRPVKKPTVPESPRNAWDLDWYALGLLLLGILTVAPYVVSFFKDSGRRDEIVNRQDFEQSQAKVETWFSLVGADSPSESAVGYAAALRKVAESESLETEHVPIKLRELIDADAATSWLDWSLFTLEMMREMQSLEKAGVFRSSLDRSGFLLAIATALEKAKDAPNVDQ
jgi:hypothetical protein